MLEKKCPLCAFETKELFKARDNYKISQQEFSIRKCLNCRIVFTFPFVSRLEAEKFYQKDIPWNKNYRPQNRFIGLIRKLEQKYISYLLEYETKELLKFAGNKQSILDIGCGQGLRLEFFKKAGFSQRFGIEPGKTIESSIIKKTSLDDFQCLENSFDAVTLYHVFEHLNNPIKSLEKIKKILKPNGLLAIQVPNFNCFQAKLLKQNWAYLSVPHHYFHYTSETISSILSQKGFEIKSISPKMNFLRSVYLWTLSIPYFNIQLIREKEEKRKKTTINRLLWFLLILILAVPAELENFLGQSKHITVYTVNKK